MAKENPSFDKKSKLYKSLYEHTSSFDKKAREDMKKEPKNEALLGIVKELRQESKRSSAKIWKAVAEMLSSPRRNIAEVNLSKIERYAKNGDDVVVPGKVLGAGRIEKKVGVAAVSFSNAARQKIKNAGGKCTSIGELIKKNPKGSGVKILR